MNNKQVLFYGVLEPTNDLRSIFAGHILCSFETYEVSKINWNISLLHYKAQGKEISFPLIIFIDKNHFKKAKYGTT